MPHPLKKKFLILKKPSNCAPSSEKKSFGLQGWGHKKIEYDKEENKDEEATKEESGLEIVPSIKIKLKKRKKIMIQQKLKKKKKESLPTLEKKNIRTRKKGK